MKSPVRLVVAVLVVGACALAACEGGQDTLQVGSIDAGAGLDGGARFDASQDAPNGTFGDSMANGYGCTGDLQSVVDPQGMVIEQCAPTKACWDGACIDPCTAAGNSHGSIGCDFEIATPDLHWEPDSEISAQPCFAIYLANNWPAPVHVTVSRGGQVLDTSVAGRVVGGGNDATQWSAIGASGVPANQVGVVFLSDDPTSQLNMTFEFPDGGVVPYSYPLTCPVAPAVAQATWLDQGAAGWFGPTPMNTQTGQAFHVTTDYPVSLYDIAPYGGAMSFLPSASLDLPTTAWGTNYVLASVPYGVGNAGFQYVDFVAATDGTMVSITPSTSILAMNGIAGADAGATVTYALSAGQYLHLENPYDPDTTTAGPNQELSGSVVQSSVPIGVVTGQTALDFATSTNRIFPDGPNTYGGAADACHQQLAPVQALGWHYVAAPFPTRRADLMAESISYRIVGAANGTQLTFDPPVTGAPASLALGQFVDFQATTAFVVASQDAQHPFEMAQMMSGGIVDSMSRPGVSPDLPIYAAMDPTDRQDWTTDALGDPDFVVVFPPEQYLTHYAFVTDPTYGTSSLVFVRQKGGGAFADVTLDCAGILTGWQPIDAAGQYEYAQFDLVRAGQGTGTCANGPHYASSSSSFGVIVWGMDAFSSYGYPAGGNVGAINTVVVPVQ